MQSDDQETLYSQQNLWIIDERLTFHTYIASDKKLSSIESGLSVGSQKRPDLFIFDRKISFSEPVDDEGPINSLVVIEFKKPQRDDYTDAKNPLNQIYAQITDIRSGTFKDDNGRPVRTANATIPAYGYVICDITPTLEKILKDNDAMPTPNGLAYYGYNRNHQIYYEVIDYGKLVSDAKKRNRIFFERLKIN